MKILLIFCLGMVSAAAAQSVQSAYAPASFAGCVAKLPLPNQDRYVLASGGRCMLLSGTFAPAKVADHEVVLRGTLIGASGLEPLTLNVDSTVAIKDACSQTCVLEPPGARGVHNKEKPGSQGGTPGAAPSIPPQAK